MPKAVIDTNVFVSSAISGQGAPRQIFEAWRAGQFSVVTCPRQIVEVARALRYDRIRIQYGLTDEDIRSILALLWTQAEVVDDPAGIAPVSADAGDDLLLVLCRTSRADCFVSGDKPLLDLGSGAGTRIVTPRQFADQLSKTR